MTFNETVKKQLGKHLFSIEPNFKYPPPIQKVFAESKKNLLLNTFISLQFPNISFSYTELFSIFCQRMGCLLRSSNTKFWKILLKYVAKIFKILNISRYCYMVHIRRSEFVGKIFCHSKKYLNSEFEIIVVKSMANNIKIPNMGREYTGNFVIGRCIQYKFQA